MTRGHGADRGGSLASWPHLAALAAMLAAAAGAAALAPAAPTAPDAGVDLDALVPRQFGDWREVRSAFAQVDLTPRRDGAAAERTTDSPYDQTVMRTYVRSDGAVVMLALAYGRAQRQEVKIHRPELCYAAQGFAVAGRHGALLALDGGRTVPVTRLLAKRPNRVEPVSYWIRIGDEIAQSAWQSRLAILRAGLHGRIPDGILVRASTPLADGRSSDDAYAVQGEFLRELLAALDPRVRQLLVAADAIRREPRS